MKCLSYIFLVVFIVTQTTGCSAPPPPEQKPAPVSTPEISQKVGVICDTGIDTDHPFFKDSKIITKDFTGSRYGVEDKHGHGTNVASIMIKYSQNKGIYYVGKVFGDNGSAYGSWVDNCFKWGFKNGGIVYNYSGGGKRYSDFTQKAFTFLKENGKIGFKSAGNEGKYFTYPCRDNHLIGSVDKHHRLADTSSYLPPRRSGCSPMFAVNYGVGVECAKLGGRMGRCWGTSFAAPATAGLALLAVIADSINFDMVVELFRFKILDLPKEKQGHGLTY